MTVSPLDVPPGLNGVAVADTVIGDVRGDEGFYHYRQYDACELARTQTFEDVWFLVANGALPGLDELAAFRAAVADRRFVPDQLALLTSAVAETDVEPLARLRTVLSASGAALDIRPLLDLNATTRAAQGLKVSAFVPAVLAALHRASAGQQPVAPDPSLGHVAAYLYEATGELPEPAAVRALEQYLILTIDHGFNASTFTGRVVASTGASMIDVVCASLGALAGALHGGAPGRALDALDAIGEPSQAAEYVRHEVAAGRRIMGFGHAVYRTVDPPVDTAPRDC